MSDRMTPTELDAVCCRFAGIAPKAFDVFTEDGWKSGTFILSGVTDGDEAVTLWHNTGRTLRPVYPPVSTDGGAMLLLMEALRKMGVFHRVEFDDTRRLGEQYHSVVHFYKSRCDSAPMALALAVAVAVTEGATTSR